MDTNSRVTSESGVTWVGPSRVALHRPFAVDVVEIASGFDAEAVSLRTGETGAVGADSAGRRIAVGDEPAELIDFATESTIRIFDPATGDLIRAIEVPSGRVIDLSFQPDGDLLAVGTEDAGLYVVDTNTGDIVFSRATLVGAAGRFSPDGTQLAVRDRAGTVTVLESSTGDVVLPAVTHTGELRNVFFARNGDGLLVDAVTSIISVNMDGREPLATAPFGTPGEFPGAVRSDSEIVWAFRSPLELVPGNLDQSTSTAYRPADGEVVGTISDLASFYGPDEAWLYLSQITGKGVVANPTSGTTLYASDWNLGDRFMLGGPNPGATIYVWASFDGQLLDIRRLPELTPVETTLGPFDWNMLTFAISTDARQIAFAVSDNNDEVALRVFDIASGEEVIEPISWPLELALPRVLTFTLDDATLAVGDRAGDITQVNLTTRALSASRFEGMHGPVVGLEFTDDGRLIAISNDGTIRLFDAASRQPLGPPIVWATRADDYSFHGGYLPSWDLTDKHLLVADPDGLRLWNIDPATWPAVACERAGRNLTQGEWARYMPTDEPYRITCSQFPGG